jgi:hypothetical protein
MSVTVYINHRNERARVHEDDCNQLHKKGGGGKNGEYRYFNDNDEAWEWMNDNLDGYECSDCHYCDPEDN